MRWQTLSRTLGDTIEPRDQFGDPLSQVLRWPTERSRNWTSQFLKSAEANGAVFAVVAIGSSVRPNVPSTDLDLILISSREFSRGRGSNGDRSSDLPSRDRR
jgi:hypothetical protein